MDLVVAKGIGAATALRGRRRRDDWRPSEHGMHRNVAGSEMPVDTAGSSPEVGGPINCSDHWTLCLANRVTCRPRETHGSQVAWAATTLPPYLRPALPATGLSSP
jgi:hypothetical protein